MGHGHSHGTDSIRAAFFLNLAFTVIELIGGVLTNSIAILSDALHDLGDSLSLGLSWWLEAFSARPASARFTYGMRRFSLLGSLINAVVLLSGSLFILTEAVPRLFAPQETNSPGMIGLAVLGVVVNGMAVLKLRPGKSENIKTLSWHLLEDVLGWAAVLVGSLLIYLTEWYVIDPLLSLGITCFILWNVFRRLNSTVSLFLQAAPTGIDTAEIAERIGSLSGVLGHHHMHVWSLDGEHHVLTTHIEVEDNSAQATERLKEEVRRLAAEFGFSHVTVEIDLPGECCSMAAG